MHAECFIELANDPKLVDPDLECTRYPPLSFVQKRAIEEKRSLVLLFRLMKLFFNSFLIACIQCMQDKLSTCPTVYVAPPVQ